MKSKSATFADRWEEINDLFRRRLYLVRIQLGLSQAEVGNRVGMTRFAIGDIEGGIRSPRVPEAVMICDRLGVTLADMLGDAEPVLVTENRIEFRPHATTPR